MKKIKKFCFLGSFVLALLFTAGLPVCTNAVEITILEPQDGATVSPLHVSFNINFSGTTDTEDLEITLGGVPITGDGAIRIGGQNVVVYGFAVSAPVISFRASGLPSGEFTLTVSLAGASATSTFEVDPDLEPWAISFYAVNYLGSNVNGLLMRYLVNQPASPVAQNSVPVNGAISIDGHTGIVGGGLYTIDNNPIRAMDGTTLQQRQDLDITGLSHSGSLSTAINAQDRLFFLFDTVARRIQAISLDESNYGRVVVSQIFTDLAASQDTDIGDMMAVDHAGHQLFVTGGDGGVILSIDINGLSFQGGSFGVAQATGQRCRSINNSAGMLAIDEVHGRVFTFLSSNTVRAFSASPPYSTLRDYSLPFNLSNDCGAWYDWRIDRLYIGTGASLRLLILDPESGNVEQFNFPAPHSIDGISLDGPSPF